MSVSIPTATRASAEVRDRNIRHWALPLAAGLLLILIPAVPAQPSPPSGTPAYFIRAIVVDPHTPDTLYVATDNQGLLKSVDGGKSWSFINQGLKNYLVYDLKPSATAPGRLYAATWGGGFYYSEDGGASWREANDGLSNTAVGEIAVEVDTQATRDRLTIGTPTKLYERRDDQLAWHPVSGRLRFWDGPQFQNALVVGPDSGTLYIGTQSGLYAKPRNARGWKAVAGLKGKRIAAMAARPESGWLYAGTIADGGLFVSRNKGVTWQPTGSGLETSWIRAILFDPSSPKRLYIATSDGGVIKSDDDGVTWRVISTGLPSKDVRTLALDPQHPDHLFAGLHGAGLYTSPDGGASWTKVEGLPYEPVEMQSALIDAQTPPSSLKPALPAAFAKCNQCHGWTDPALNQKPTIWRAAANHRSGGKWRATVARMSKGTTISEEEQGQIASFLDRYTSVPAPAID